MSREIKFRAWNIDEERWCTIGEIEAKLIINPHYYPSGGGVCEINEHKGTDVAYDLGYSVQLQQYTGLKDKNGKEVHEGDIVHNISTSESFEIEWDSIGTGYLFHNINHSRRTHGIDYYEFEDMCGSFGFEIIGNIHENPELLKEASA